MGSVEVAQDLEFHRRMWRIERVGWAALVAFLLAAALGVFGDGPLSTCVAAAPDGSFRVEYPRFGRVASPLSLRVRPSGDAARALLRVELSADYAEAIEIERVTPPPERVEIGQDRLVFCFGGDGSPSPPAITFSFEASHPGLLEGTISLGGSPVRLRHILYP